MKEAKQTEKWETCMTDEQCIEEREGHHYEDDI